LAEDIRLDFPTVIIIIIIIIINNNSIYSAISKASRTGNKVVSRTIVQTDEFLSAA